VQPEFPEVDYLAANPDVAQAVARGDFKSGLHHYEIYGRKEGRLPKPLRRHRVDGDLRLAVGNFFDDQYLSINGMSSQLAARCMAEILIWQGEAGLSGAVLELGVFEGRTFVLMALAATGDAVTGIDTFVHPDDDKIDRFRRNLDRFGIDQARVREIKASTLEVSAASLLSTMGSVARFIHVDADHTYESVKHDIALAHQCLAPEGVLCLDDVLHPVYPGLTLAVHEYLQGNSDLRIFAIIDRELVTSSTKYLVCRVPCVFRRSRPAIPRSCRPGFRDDVARSSERCWL